MNLTTIASILGGIGLFLLGMQMMTDGLKLAAGNALRSILQSWTSSNTRGLLAGALITAIVQSSSAATVAIVGFVNAGLLTLSQAAWVIFGANVGTTTTGWLVALVGVRVDVSTLALPLLGIGMLLRLTARTHKRRAGFGQAIAGFGAFFLGVGILQTSFSDVTPLLDRWPIAPSGALGTLSFVAAGIVLTLLTQSSSATVAITLTAAAGGTIPLNVAAAIIIGASIGTTSTAWFASVGATPPAKRAAWAHISFQLLTGAVALVILPVLLAASTAIVAALSGRRDDLPATLAVFHTLYSLLGVTLMWPLAPRFVQMLSKRFVSREEEIGRPKHLDTTLVDIPALALRVLVVELERMSALTFELAARRVRGTVAEPASSLQEKGLVQLGNAVRDFIGSMSQGVLPDDVVVALPDLLRASQHLEDVATASAHTGPHRSRGQAAAHAEGSSPDWAALREAVLAVLTSKIPPAELTPRAKRIELSYESLKTTLLKAGARGQLHVDAMEEDLLRARRLRRLADSALKAHRRLDPWITAMAAASTSAAPATVDDAKLDAGAPALRTAPLTEARTAHAAQHASG